MAILGLCTAIPVPAGLFAKPSVYFSNAITPLHTVTKSQFHTQDELGQYSYGYADGLSSKTESKSLDGITHGSYSYLDSNGIVQNVNYIADDVNGFRVAASNLPVGPAAVAVNSAAVPVPQGPAVPLVPSGSPVGVHDHHLSEPEPIYAPVQQLPHPALSDPIQAGFPYQPHPGYLPGAAPGFHDIRPQYDPNVAADEDSVEVTAAKIFADHIPQPVQDTPEVTAAKVQHMAALQEAIAAQHLANRNSQDDGSYRDNADVLQADPALHAPLTSLPLATPPHTYPYGHQYHHVSAPNVMTQYHSQDELGQYSYGYAGGPSAKTEIKTLDGVTRGSYSYIDANGEVQRVNYISDATHGFRVSASNLPSAPSADHDSNHLTETPEVARAKSLHFAAHEQARRKVLVASA
ncbi:hypothetical protein M8J76_000156 [Diaphorina citri]|nr:hypothetical protein M8J75_015703 [Diaphorina citri]KAI5713476.1 hypothetical protein M8J76_000156 [Diaphorina citri]